MTNEEILQDEDSQKILKTLVTRTSMPLMELKYLCQIEMHKLQKSVNELEENGFVYVKEPTNPLEEIVTLKSKGFDAANLLFRMESYIT